MRILSLLLLALLFLAGPSSRAATPAFTSFIGSNGVTVLTNPVTGKIIIVGSGASAADVTNTISALIGTNTTPPAVTLIINGTSLDTQTSPPAGAGNSWPDFLMTNSPWFTIRIVTNAARSGQLSEEIMSRYATNIESRWLPDYRTAYALYFHGIGGAVNDILNNGKSGEASWLFTKTNLLAANRNYLRTIASTIASNGVFATNQNFNDRRLAYNNNVRLNRRMFDFLIDLDTLFTNTPVDTTTFEPDLVHYKAAFNVLIASNIFRTVGPWPSEYLKRANGAFTNTTDGLVLGDAIYLGNYSPLAPAFRYAGMGPLTLSSNNPPAGFWFGPGGDTWLNSPLGSSGISWRLNGSQFVNLDGTTGIMDVRGGGLQIPGGYLHAGLLSVFTNSISVPVSAVDGYIFTSSNGVAGTGVWKPNLYTGVIGGSENAVVFFDSNGSMSQDVNFFKYLSTAKRLEVYGKIAAITNGAAVTETEILVVTNNLITLYNPSDFVPTNNAASNLTMNAATGPIVRRLFITNNITITNITPPAQGQNVAFKWRIEPQLIPRGLLLPTLNGNQFGVRLETNANNTVWTTLTNGVTYDLVVDFWGTNGRVAISEWKL